MESMNIQEEARIVQRISSDLALLKRSLAKEKEELAKATEHIGAVGRAQDILQHLAQAVQQQVHKRISEVVSSCLSAVFDDPYEFHIIFERKRGRTEASLRFLRRGLDVDPLTASGGGVVDVAAFALRVACLMLHRPKLSRIIILDEPFRFVSAQYQENVRQMIEELSKDLKIQIIQVTHNDNLVTGKTIDLS